MEDDKFLMPSEYTIVETNLQNNANDNDSSLTTSKNIFNQNARNARLTISFYKLCELNFSTKLIQRMKKKCLYLKWIRIRIT